MLVYSIMDEHEYEWQTKHTSKANALEALAKHRTGVETELELPNAPGDLEKEAADLLKETRLKNDLKENLRAKMHVANQMHLADPELPDGSIDLNPNKVTGRYPGEKSNPLDPIAQVTAGLKAMPPPSTEAASASATQKEVAEKARLMDLAGAIFDIGSQCKLYKTELARGEEPGNRMIKTKRIKFQKLFMFFDKSVKPCNYKTGWLSSSPDSKIKFFCNVAQELNKIVLKLITIGKGGSPAGKGLIDLFLTLARPFILMRDKVVASKSREPVDILMEMTQEEVQLENKHFLESLPSVPKGGKRKTRKYKKRHVKKSKTRKGKKSRKHKSKTHKRRKHRRGRKSRKH